MADTAAALVIQLTAETRQFQREMKKATGVFDAEGRKIEKRQTQLQKNFEKGFGRLTSGLLSTAAVGAFGRHILNTADALSDAALQLGITTQELQGLDYAARTSGASSEKLSQALSTLSDGLGEAQRGEGAMAEAMRRSGVQMGTTIEVLYDVADLVKAARTETEKMNIATTYLGAKGGKTMVSFLNQGADGLRRLQQEASAKGQIWDAATLAKLDSAKDSFETIQKAFVNIAALPASVFMNDLAGLLDALGNGDWQAGIDKLARLMPVIAGVAIGGRVGGLPGAAIGGLAGLAVENFLPQDAPAKAAAPKASPPKRTTVPNSAADVAAALRAAQQIREIISSASEDTRRASDDSAEAMRNVVREQDSALLARAQGWTDFADIQRKVIEELSVLDVSSINDRKNAELAALEVRKAADLERLTELEASTIQKAEIEEQYARQRASIEYTTSQEILAIRAREAGDIAQIHTNSILVTDGVRQGLLDIGKASLQGFGSMQDAAARALQTLAEMVLEIGVLKPLIEGLLGPSGSSSGGLGGAIMSGIMSSFSGGFATGGNIPKGQWGIVGERGPEPIRSTAAGVQVMPSSSLRSMPSIPSIGAPTERPLKINIRQEPGVVVEQVGTTAQEVEFIARRIVHSEGPTVAAMSQRNPNGELAKATRDTLRASRRRN